MSETGNTRSVSIFLVISLMINMLLIGIVGGRMIGRAGQPPPDMAAVGTPTEARVARRILDSVSPRERIELGRMFSETLRENRDTMIARNRARIALSQAMTAEPYDEARVRDAMAALRDADFELQAVVQDALAASMARLTPEQREALAVSIERSAPIGQFQSRGGPGGRPPQPPPRD
ncbi:MAG: periplasmic heavy metal sensor [Pseudomonadota bacterium]